MSRRDLTGVVDVSVLDQVTGGDDGVAEEVLGLFVQQAAMWSPMLDARIEGWRDAVHTIRGASAGIGAGELAAICAEAEAADTAVASVKLDQVRNALNEALADVAAWRHELMLRSLKA